MTRKFIIIFSAIFIAIGLVIFVYNQKKIIKKIVNLEKKITNSEELSKNIIAYLINTQDINNKAFLDALEKINKHVSPEFINYFVNKLIKQLQVYDIYLNNQQIKLQRIGKDYDGGYLVPLIALEKSDVLIGYGVANDISFEETYSSMFKKPSFGFDCTVKNINTNNILTKFIPECLVSKNSINLIHEFKSKGLDSSTFAEEIEKYKLHNKNLFIKMDIESAEFETLPDIINYSETITGIILELHTENNLYRLVQAEKLLENINKNFVLVHIHGNNCCGGFSSNLLKGKLPQIIELSYINKNLVEHYEPAANKVYPTILDMKNAPEKDDHKFSFID